MKKEHLNNLMDLHNVNGRQRTNNLYSAEVDGDDAFDEVDDITFIIGTVRIVHNITLFICLDTVLINHLLQRGPRAETVFIDFRWDAGNGEEIVVFQLCFVSVEFHFLHLKIDRHIGNFNAFNVRIWILCFVVDVDVCEFRACLCKSRIMG